MKQGMEMKVNRLPMRTWNWLHMNDSSLSDIDTEIYGKNMVSCNPQFTLPGQGVSCIRGMSAGTLESGFQELKGTRIPKRRSGFPGNINREKILCMRSVFMRRREAASR